MTTPFFKKLKLDQFKKVAYLSRTQEKSPFDRLGYSKYLEENTDLVIMYVYTLDQMKTAIEKISGFSGFLDGGQLYLCYPKTTNKLGYPPIHRDDIFPFLKVDSETGYIEGTDLKFNKMLAIDENYTLVAIKKVTIRKKKTKGPSARVNDYLEYLPQIEAYLSPQEELLNRFTSLTFGKQKAWARYIYSASRLATKEKRLLELEESLKVDHFD